MINLDQFKQALEKEDLSPEQWEDWLENSITVLTIYRKYLETHEPDDLYNIFDLGAVTRLLNNLLSFLLLEVGRPRKKGGTCTSSL